MNVFKNIYSTAALKMDDIYSKLNALFEQMDNHVCQRMAVKSEILSMFEKSEIEKDALRVENLLLTEENG